MYQGYAIIFFEATLPLKEETKYVIIFSRTLFADN